jgi:hypothetical protein
LNPVPLPPPGEIDFASKSRISHELYTLQYTRRPGPRGGLSPQGLTHLLEVALGRENVDWHLRDPGAVCFPPVERKANPLRSRLVSVAPRALEKLEVELLSRTQQRDRWDIGDRVGNFPHGVARRDFEVSGASHSAQDQDVDRTLVLDAKEGQKILTDAFDRNERDRAPPQEPIPYGERSYEEADD